VKLTSLGKMGLSFSYSHQKARYPSESFIWQIDILIMSNKFTDLIKSN